MVTLSVIKHKADIPQITTSEIPVLGVNVAKLGPMQKVIGVGCLSGRRQKRGQEGTRMAKVGLRNEKKKKA